MMEMRVTSLLRRLRPVVKISNKNINHSREGVEVEAGGTRKTFYRRLGGKKVERGNIVLRDKIFAPPMKKEASPYLNPANTRRRHFKIDNEPPMKKEASLCLHPANTVSSW